MRITPGPAQQPCIRDTGIRVAQVLKLLSAGLTAEQIVAEFPRLEVADVRACLEFAARSAAGPPPLQGSAVTPPLALEYQSARQPPLIYPVGTAIRCMILAFLLTAILSFITPRFEQIFKDFGTTLPASTALLLELSNHFRRDIWPLISLWLLAGVAPLLIGLLLSPLDADERRHWQRMLNLGILLLCFLVILLAILALFMPMLALIQTASTPKRKK